MKSWLLVLLLLLPTPALAADELFGPEEKQKMMMLALKHLWGHAIDSNGNLIEPKDDAERTTLPISYEQGSYIINKGGEAGLAQWCGVKWQERFQLMMEQLRTSLSSETQAAYAGVLHGIAQGIMHSAMKQESCDAKTKKQVTRLIKDDVKNLSESLKAE